MTRQEKINNLRTLVWDAAIEMDEKQELDHFLDELEKVESKEPQELTVCGKYCGDCVHAQWGSGNKEKYYTFCSALATMVRTTDNPLDQCPHCVLEGAEVPIQTK